MSRHLRRAPQLLVVLLVAVGARPHHDGAAQPPATSQPDDQPNDQPRDRCEKLRRAVKKVLTHVDHLSELDHQDYVVSDREYELVLKRIGNGRPAEQTSDRPVGRGHTDAAAGHEQGDECFICLEEFGRTSSADGGAEITLLCGHRFHLACIEDWAGARQPRSSRCPICIGLMRRQDGRRFIGRADQPAQQ